MDKSKKVLLLSNIIMVGFVIGVVIYYVLGQYLNLPFPFNTFLFYPSDAFNDFMAPIKAARSFAPYATPNLMINYFPLAYIIMFPFSLIKNNMASFIIFIFIFLTVFVYLNNKFVRCKELTKTENFSNIFIFSLLTYPLLYILDRGNFDMGIFFLFVGFIYAFKSQKYLLSAVLLAVQNAIKPFPILFLILFLHKKKYKEFFLSLFLIALLVFIGFFILKGPVLNQISVFLQNLYLFKVLNVTDVSLSNGMANGSSLFAALKFIFCQYNNIISTTLLANIYSYISFFITFVTLIFVWKETLFWKKITLLTFLMLLLPYITGDYKLIFLFVPIWLFLNTEEKSKFDLIYTVFFGLLLIPKKMFMFFAHTQAISKLVTFGVLINPIIMLIFIGLIIFEQILKRKKEKINE